MLTEQITTDLTAALKSGDSFKTQTLRLLLAAIKQYDIDHYPPNSEGSMTEEEVLNVVLKQIKQRKDSIAAFEKGGRQDLVDIERKELSIIEQYRPAQMSDEELISVIKEIIASGMNNSGAIMGAVMKKVSGKADGSRVMPLVQKLMNG